MSTADDLLREHALRNLSDVIDWMASLTATDQTFPNWVRIALVEARAALNAQPPAPPGEALASALREATDWLERVQQKYDPENTEHAIEEIARLRAALAPSESPP